MFQGYITLLKIAERLARKEEKIKMVRKGLINEKYLINTSNQELTLDREKQLKL